MPNTTTEPASVRDDERITTFGLLHEAHRRLERAFGGSLTGRCGITGPFFEVMLRIGRSPGGRLTMSELALQLGLTSGGATRLVDRVVEAGLVARTSCPSDRRVQWVVLTAAGETKLDEALVVHLADLQHELVDRLDPEELVVLRRALDKLHVESPTDLERAAGAVDQSPGAQRSGSTTSA